MTQPPTLLQLAEVWATILGNLAIIAGVIAAVRHIRTLKIDRTAHLVVEMSRWLDGLDEHLLVLRRHQNTLIDWRNHEDEAAIAFRAVGNFFELVGALVADKTLDLQIVDAAIGLSGFQTFYSRYASEINAMRAGDDQQYKWIVRLATDPVWQRAIARVQQKH